MIMCRCHMRLYQVGEVAPAPGSVGGELPLLDLVGAGAAAVNIW
jgi:hypothetical protein